MGYENYGDKRFAIFIDKYFCYNIVDYEISKV